MSEVLTLVKRSFDDDGCTLLGETRREVFMRLASIGQQEFYQAQATDLRPELKFVLEDYLDYEGEYLCIYGEVWYRVIRTYRTGQALEVIVQRASAEEIGDEYDPGTCICDELDEIIALQESYISGEAVAQEVVADE